MDANSEKNQNEKQRLLNRLAELLVEEERAKGTFQGVPHFSDLENASHTLAQLVSRVSLERVSAEVAANCDSMVACPSCGERHPASLKKRKVKSIDGLVELSEPTAYCPTCRRAFFPSASGARYR